MGDLVEREVFDIAKAICAENCAFRGEPPCWQAEGHKGELSPHCDEPGCLALAVAAHAAIRALSQGDADGRPD